MNAKWLPSNQTDTPVCKGNFACKHMTPTQAGNKSTVAISEKREVFLSANNKSPLDFPPKSASFSLFLPSLKPSLALTDFVHFTPKKVVFLFIFIEK